MIIGFLQSRNHSKNKTHVRQMMLKYTSQQQYLRFTSKSVVFAPPGLDETCKRKTNNAISIVCMWEQYKQVHSWDFLVRKTLQECCMCLMCLNSQEHVWKFTTGIITRFTTGMYRQCVCAVIDGRWSKAGAVSHYSEACLVLPKEKKYL